MKHRIKEILKERGITQKEFADMLGTSLPNIKSMVSSQNLSMSTLNNVAKALNIDAYNLLAPDTPPENSITCPHCGKKIRFEKE